MNTPPRLVESRALRALAFAITLAAPSVARAQEASAQLAQTIGSLAAQMAPGQKPVSKVHGAFGPYREGVSFTVNLTAGRCYTFIGSGGAGVADVDMFLFDPAARRVAVDRRDDAWMRITHCASFTGQYRVELKVKRGEGEVGFRVYSGKAPGRNDEEDDDDDDDGDDGDREQHAAPPPPPPPPPPPATGKKGRKGAAPAPSPAEDTHPLARQLALAAATFAPGLRLALPVVTGITTEDRPNDQFLQLEAGRCYTIVSVASPSVRALFTYLWAPYTNKRLATDRADTNTSHLQVCTTMPGMYHFQAKADEGAGEFRTGVYTGP